VSERSELHRIEANTEQILRILSKSAIATGFQIWQIIGGKMQSDVTGIAKGATGSFTATLVPVGAAPLQAAPVFTCDDPDVTLTPSADGFSVTLATITSDPDASADLTLSGIASDGSQISSSVNVPLSAGTGGGVVATGFDIKQTAAVGARRGARSAQPSQQRSAEGGLSATNR
jgi:hypothetical protein